MASVRFASGAVASVVNSVLSPRQEITCALDLAEATVELTHLYGYAGDGRQLHARAGVAPRPGRALAFEPDQLSGHPAQIADVVGRLLRASPRAGPGQRPGDAGAGHGDLRRRSGAGRVPRGPHPRPSVLPGDARRGAPPLRPRPLPGRRPGAAGWPRGRGPPRAAAGGGRVTRSRPAPPASRSGWRPAAARSASPARRESCSATCTSRATRRSSRRGRTCTRCAPSTATSSPSTGPTTTAWHKGISLALPNLGEANFWGGVTFRRGLGYVQLPNNGRRHVAFDRIGGGAGPARVDERLRWVTEPGETWLEESRALAASLLPGERLGAVVPHGPGQRRRRHPADRQPDHGGPPAGRLRRPVLARPAPVHRRRDRRARGRRRGDDGPPRALAGLAGRKYDEVDRASTVAFSSTTWATPGHPTEWFTRGPFACICPAPFFSAGAGAAHRWRLDPALRRRGGRRRSGPGPGRLAVVDELVLPGPTGCPPIGCPPARGRTGGRPS